MQQQINKGITGGGLIIVVVVRQGLIGLARCGDLGAQACQFVLQRLATHLGGLARLFGVFRAFIGGFDVSLDLLDLRNGAG